MDRGTPRQKDIHGTLAPLPTGTWAAPLALRATEFIALSDN